MTDRDQNIAGKPMQQQRLRVRKHSDWTLQLHEKQEMRQSLSVIVKCNLKHPGTVAKAKKSDYMNLMLHIHSSSQSCCCVVSNEANVALYKNQTCLDCQLCMQEQTWHLFGCALTVVAFTHTNKLTLTSHHGRSQMALDVCSAKRYIMAKQQIPSL